MKLTKREIDALGCPPGRRDRIVFDDSLPGFGIRVTANGAKTFVLQYQLGGRAGRRTRLVLGSYGEITPAEAHRLAEIARAKLRLGQDPAGERRAAIAATAAAADAQHQARQAAAFTVRTLIDQWGAGPLADRSATHRTEAPRAIKTTFAALLDQPAQSVTTLAVQRVLDAVAKSHPIAARRTRDYGRAAFNWGVGRGLITVNPFAGVSLDVREASRDRVLSDAELAEVWRAAAATAYPFGPLVQLLILTLQRRGEVAGMRWSELAEDLSTWTIPARRAKNRKAHIVHLAEPARAILRALHPSDRRALVFTTNDRVPVSGFSRAHEDLKAAIVATREAAGHDRAGKHRAARAAPDWRWHDFRRTGVTALVRLGFATHVADRLLNHVQGSIKGVAAVYQRYDFMPEREAALYGWAQHVLAVAAALDRTESLPRSDTIAEPSKASAPGASPDRRRGVGG
ncbi:tyrosine-type recombinase/integrase [Rhodopila sp.]|uniref:tyrosine-type recombinase/integrase n=1 Tax=Rhodopila sp. TaxID=2480087 RepID=UPI003D0E54CB